MATVLRQRRQIVQATTTVTVQGEDDPLIWLHCEIEIVTYRSGQHWVTWFAEGLLGSVEIHGKLDGNVILEHVRDAVRIAYHADTKV